MISTRSILAALVAATLFATPAVAAQEQTSDPATVAAEQARAAAEAALGPRFQPREDGYGGCVNEPTEAERIRPTPAPANPTVAAWQVSSPRAPIRAGDPAKLGLRDKFGTATRRVGAVVVRPDGTSDRTGHLLAGDRWTYLSYPDGFVWEIAPTTPGTYTVIWRDTATDGFLACDGFVVVP